MVKITTMSGPQCLYFTWVPNNTIASAHWYSVFSLPPFFTLLVLPGRGKRPCLMTELSSIAVIRLQFKLWSFQLWDTCPIAVSLLVGKQTGTHLTFGPSSTKSPPSPTLEPLPFSSLLLSSLSSCAFKFLDCFLAFDGVWVQERLLGLPWRFGSSMGRRLL